MLYIFELKEQLLKYKRNNNKVIIYVIYVCVYFMSAFAGRGRERRDATLYKGCITLFLFVIPLRPEK